MKNAYVWAHEICGELHISKSSWGSQKWAEFLNEIVLGFSKSIGTTRFREKKSDFATVLLYTFSGLHFLRDELIFRVPIGRCAPPSGRPCEQLTKSPPSRFAPEGGGLCQLLRRGVPPRGGTRPAGGSPLLFLPSLLPLPSLCSPLPLFVLSPPSPFFFFPNPDEERNKER